MAAKCLGALGFHSCVCRRLQSIFAGVYIAGEKVVVITEEE